MTLFSPAARDRDTFRGKSRQMARARTSPQPEVPGLAARRIAADILDGVLRRRLALDEQLAGKGAHPGLAALADRDRALMRRLDRHRAAAAGHAAPRCSAAFSSAAFPATRRAARPSCSSAPRRSSGSTCPTMPRSICRCGWRRPTGARRAMPGWSTPCCGAWRRTAMRCSPTTPRATRRTGCSSAGPTTYGADTARAIAIANGHEPALDLTAKQDAASWAERLRGRVLPTGTVRTLAQGAITLLPGFAEGAWWVQDAAAALPARLFGDMRGRSVADLCAAPGGKTAQLAACRRPCHRRRPLAGPARPRLPKTSRGSRSKPKPSPPTRWNGSRSRPMAEPSTPCCSMRPAPRPAPSAAIPTCPG